MDKEKLRKMYKSLGFSEEKIDEYIIRLRIFRNRGKCLKK